MKNKINNQDQSGELKSSDPEAIILDIDGVVANTTPLHIKSWKETFRRYLKKSKIKFSPFSEKDYLSNFDGRPELKFLEDFLASRGILLSEGTDQDQVNGNTIWSLYNLKRQIFKEILERNSVEQYIDAVSTIKHWKSMGLKCGAISLVWDCSLIVEKTGSADHFDILFDGLRINDDGLLNMSLVDILRGAAKKMDVSTDKCVVIMDTVAGVQAGTLGNFSLVAGVNHSGIRKLLTENGADIVVDDIKQIDLNSKELKMFFTEFAPSLFSNLEEFLSLMKNKKPALFLDYDGTLTPIVKNPSEAILSEEMRSVLSTYSKRFPLAIISGRDMDDLIKLVRIRDIVYGGSHGFRISGPGGLYMEHPDSEIILPELNRIEGRLHHLFDDRIKGIKVERKRYAIAVHYRNVIADNVPFVIREVENIIHQSPGFRRGEGKKVIEVRPDVDWHKGRAIDWLLERPEFYAGQEVVPIYIGDDLTDEDVFETLPESGIGILAGFHGGKSRARYSLKNVYQVRLFIEMLTNYNQK